MNFLEGLRLIELTGQKKGGDARRYSGDDFGFVEFTELGHEAFTMGLRPYLRQRKERDEMRHRANRATARGYRINLWGIIFLVFGLVVSVVNIYIFYRQVFDPPVIGLPTEGVGDAQQPDNDPEHIRRDSNGKEDSLVGTPQMRFREEPIEAMNEGNDQPAEENPKAIAPQ